MKTETSSKPQAAPKLNKKATIAFGLAGLALMICALASPKKEKAPAGKIIDLEPDPEGNYAVRPKRGEEWTDPETGETVYVQKKPGRPKKNKHPEPAAT